MSLPNFSAAQLRNAAEIKAKIETLQAQLNRLLNGSSATGPGAKPAQAGKKRVMSAAARAKIAKAAKARWAKAKAAGKKRL